MLQKVVCCGWHRTGSTSLHAALEEVGYTVHGFDRRLSDELMIGNYAPIFRAARRADALRDFPWSVLYRELDQRFPNSKFILTLRSSESWLESYVRHRDENPKTPLHRWLYSGDDTDDDRVVTVYEEHNAAVRHWFRGREDQLLLLDVISGHGWAELCDFLGIPAPDRPFPRESSAIFPIPDSRSRVIRLRPRGRAG